MAVEPGGFMIWNSVGDLNMGTPQRIKPGTEKELLTMYGIDENDVHHSDWAFTGIAAVPAKPCIIENMEDEDEAVSKVFFTTKNSKYTLYSQPKNVIYRKYNICTSWWLYRKMVLSGTKGKLPKNILRIFWIIL